MGNIEFINKERNKLLTGHDYTASIRTQVLSLVDCIPFQLFLDLNKARKARNDWMHEMKKPVENDASSAIRTAETFLQKVTGIRLQVPLCYSETLTYQIT